VLHRRHHHSRRSLVSRATSSVLVLEPSLLSGVCRWHPPVGSHPDQQPRTGDYRVGVPVPADLPRGRRAAELVGRRAESAVLDQLIVSARSGMSRALVVHGEPGIGKTALLEYLVAHAVGFRVVRGGGVQSEMELPFAGLQQLCAPLLDRLGHLPVPQRSALRTAFGLEAGPAPDRFVVGLAVLNLLSDVAQERPLLCLVDDHQWLDGASAQALAFVARRLGTESVGLVFATRTISNDLTGLPELLLDGLGTTEAAALLDSVLTGPVDTRVRDQLIAETRGNPLALLELPRGFTPAQLAGGFGLPGPGPLTGKIEESFARRAAAAPEPARQLLLIAASDPSGDTALVWRAATTLGIDTTAATPAIETGLIELGTRTRFRHPLARSAVYHSATLHQRQQTHHALAQATNPQLDPDRRAWHRAQAATGPDENIATELEHSAGRARARGGLPAAAAFLLRAATLTLDPAHRATRALAAAQTHLQAGSYTAALDLLAMANTGPLTDPQHAQTDLIQAHLAFVTNRGSDAPPLLLRAAKRLQTTNPQLSRATYLDALSAAIFAGRLATPGAGLAEVARAVDEAPVAPDEPSAADLLLDGMAAMYNRGYAAGLPMLRRALADFGSGLSAEEELHWLWLGSTSAMQLCDNDAWDVLSARHVELARSVGALSELPVALALRGLFLLFSGELTEADALTEEARAVQDATGTNLAPYTALAVSAFRGDELAATKVLEATIEDVTRRGEGIGITMAEWANAVLCNGLGHYPEAVSAARRSIGDAGDGGSLALPCVELIEAAVRTEQIGLAEDVYGRLAEATAASGTDWGLGLQARCQALLSHGEQAEHLYQQAIQRLATTRLRVDLARAHLLYGEWLRRQRRHNEAREQLRTAHTHFETIGMTAFTERTARELRAAGGTARKRTDATRYDDLTPQETQIARMARDGLSNPEIAGRLFISPHTVQYHLRKVFTKLGVTSRTHLRQALR
jgi:DNA-binding CsgD family transcriptional regulator/tetratricopeptide (TPR) repeat protein